MSDLPRNVGVPHRAALRNYPRQKGPEKSVTDQAKMAPLKRPAKSPKPARLPRGRTIEKPGQGLKQSDIVAFNRDAERAFVELITNILREDGKLSYRDAVREAAFELNVSVETAKRYLEKHSARRAEFCIEDGSVMLRRDNKKNG